MWVGCVSLLPAAFKYMAVSAGCTNMAVSAGRIDVTCSGANTCGLAVSACGTHHLMFFLPHMSNRNSKTAHTDLIPSVWLPMAQPGCLSLHRWFSGGVDPLPGWIENKLCMNPRCYIRVMHQVLLGYQENYPPAAPTAPRQHLACKLWLRCISQRLASPVSC